MVAVLASVNHLGNVSGTLDQFGDKIRELGGHFDGEGSAAGAGGGAGGEREEHGYGDAGDSLLADLGRACRLTLSNPSRNRNRAWFQRLKLKCDWRSFKLCFQFQLAPLHLGGGKPNVVTGIAAGGGELATAGWCRLTLSNSC
jgi:hypothetical protein